MVLFGDSHAAQWLGAFDAAAKQAGWKVVLQTKVACSVADLTLQIDTLKRPYTECDSWRATTVAAIEGLKPDLVVASQSDAVPGNQFSDAAWAAATGATLKKLAGLGIRTTLLSDAPSPTFAPTDCLAAHLENATQCASSSTARAKYWPNRRSAVATAVTQAGATVVDTTPWVCSDGKCPAIVGNMLVYRDNQGHLTSTARMGYTNPVITFNYNQDNTGNNFIQSNTFISVAPIKGVLLKTAYGIDNMYSRTQRYFDPRSDEGYTASGSATGISATREKWVWTNTANWNFAVNKAGISILSGGASPNKRSIAKSPPNPD